MSGNPKQHITNGFHCKVRKQDLDPSNIKDLEIFSVDPVSSENKLSLISRSRVTGLCTNTPEDTWQGRGRARTVNHGDSTFSCARCSHFRITLAQCIHGINHITDETGVL